MSDRIAKLSRQIQELERELKQALQEKEGELRYVFKGKQIEFDEAVRQAHLRLKKGIWPWLKDSQLKNILSVPVIYSMIVPLVFLDISVCLYQAICFRLYGIRRVKRSDYWVIDRHTLQYLNAIEKFNCAYCSYGNGVIAFVREVVARTEQYWCPIKHAHKLVDPHDRYGRFSEFGAGEHFHEELDQHRRELE